MNSSCYLLEANMAKTLSDLYDGCLGAWSESDMATGTRTNYLCAIKRVLDQLNAWEDTTFPAEPHVMSTCADKSEAMQKQTRSAWRAFATYALIHEPAAAASWLDQRNVSHRRLAYARIEAAHPTASARPHQNVPSATVRPIRHPLAKVAAALIERMASFAGSQRRHLVESNPATSAYSRRSICDIVASAQWLGNTVDEQLAIMRASHRLMRYEELPDHVNTLQASLVRLATHFYPQPDRPFKAGDPMWPIDMYVARPMNVQTLVSIAESCGWNRVIAKQLITTPSQGYFWGSAYDPDSGAIHTPFMIDAAGGRHAGSSIDRDFDCPEGKKAKVNIDANRAGYLTHEADLMSARELERLDEPVDQPLSAANSRKQAARLQQELANTPQGRELAEIYRADNRPAPDLEDLISFNAMGEKGTLCDQLVAWGVNEAVAREVADATDVASDEAKAANGAKAASNGNVGNVGNVGNGPATDTNTNTNSNGNDVAAIPTVSPNTPNSYTDANVNAAIEANARKYGVVMPELPPALKALLDSGTKTAPVQTWAHGLKAGGGVDAGDASTHALPPAELQSITCWVPEANVRCAHAMWRCAVPGSRLGLPGHVPTDDELRAFERASGKLLGGLNLHSKTSTAQTREALWRKARPFSPCPLGREISDSLLPALQREIDALDTARERGRAYMHRRDTYTIGNRVSDWRASAHESRYCFWGINQMLLMPEQQGELHVMYNWLKRAGVPRSKWPLLPPSMAGDSMSACAARAVAYAAWWGALPTQCKENAYDVDMEMPSSDLDITDHATWRESNYAYAVFAASDEYHMAAIWAGVQFTLGAKHATPDANLALICAERERAKREGYVENVPPERDGYLLNATWLAANQWGESYLGKWLALRDGVAVALGTTLDGVCNALTEMGTVVSGWARERADRHLVGLVIPPAGVDPAANAKAGLLTGSTIVHRNVVKEVGETFGA